MPGSGRRHLLALTLIAAVAGAPLALARGAHQQTIDPRTAVRPGSSITYLDLLQRLFPDATYDKDEEEVRATKSVKIRNIDEALEPTELDGDITVVSLDPMWIRADGRPVLLLTISVDAEDANEATPYEGETTILAAFDGETAARLIDALEVQTDRFTDLWETQPLLHLSSDHDAVVVQNTHFNAGESYENFALLFVSGGKFAVISDIDLLSTEACGASYTETPAYSAAPRAGRAFPDVTLRVTLKKAADGAECDRRTAGFTRTYTATYTWDAAKKRYAGDLRGLAALDRFNRQRMQ